MFRKPHELRRMTLPGAQRPSLLDIMSTYNPTARGGLPHSVPVSRLTMTPQRWGKARASTYMLPAVRIAAAVMCWGLPLEVAPQRPRARQLINSQRRGDRQSCAVLTRKCILLGDQV